MEADDARPDDAHYAEADSTTNEASMDYSTTAQRADTPCLDELEYTPPPTVAPELTTGAIFAKVQVPFRADRTPRICGARSATVSAAFYSV